MNFNQYTKDYSQRVSDAVVFSGREHDFFLAVKARHLIELAQRRFTRPAETAVLDVGCGIGLMERHLLADFPRLCGIDVAADAIREARRNAPGATFLEYEGSTLPFPDDEFDLAFAICVLHHVSPGLWGRFLGEMFRVVKPGGIVAVFEHNPLNPLTRRVVSRCEFDRDAVLLDAGTTCRLFREAGLRSIERRYILFFPWRGQPWRFLERAFCRLPAGAQYYVAGEKGVEP